KLMWFSRTVQTTRSPGTSSVTSMSDRWRSLTRKTKDWPATSVGPSTSWDHQARTSLMASNTSRGLRSTVKVVVKLWSDIWHSLPELQLKSCTLGQASGNGKGHAGGVAERNVLGGELEACGTDPMTG